MQFLNGFLQLDEDIIFKVSASNPTCEYDKDYDAWITVEVENEQPTGRVEIHKEVEEDPNNENVTYLIENIDYSKIQYKLTAAEDIIDYADNSLYYKAGDTVGIYQINDNSELIIEDIHMGKYLLQEVSTIEGCVLDKSIYEVNFEKEDNTTKVYTYKLEAKNFTTTVEIKKLGIIHNKSEMEYVRASILSLYEITEEEGQEKLTIIDEWETENVSHIVKGLKVGTKCRLIETKTSNGFVTATPIDFIVEDTDETQEIVMVDKQVTVSKKDIMGNEIEGAKLQIIDKETATIIDEWISTNEKHIVVGLEENRTYILHEEISPNRICVSKRYGIYYFRRKGK